VLEPARAAGGSLVEPVEDAHATPAPLDQAAEGIAAGVPESTRYRASSISRRVRSRPSCFIILKRSWPTVDGREDHRGNNDNECNDGRSHLPA